MKQFSLGIIFTLSSLSVFAQVDNDLLRKAIGYYQQLEYQKSLEIFDELVQSNPTDVSLQGRRGFVISEYIRAIDEKLVAKIESSLYDEYVTKGINDLRLSIKEYPSNTANKAALIFLEKKI